MLRAHLQFPRGPRASCFLPHSTIFSVYPTRSTEQTTQGRSHIVPRSNASATHHRVRVSKCMFNRCWIKLFSGNTGVVWAQDWEHAVPQLSWDMDAWKSWNAASGRSQPRHSMTAYFSRGCIGCSWGFIPHQMWKFNSQVLSTAIQMASIWLHQLPAGMCIGNKGSFS